MYGDQQGYGRGGYDRGMRGWGGRNAGHGGGYMGGPQGGYDRGYTGRYQGGYDRGYMGGMRHGGRGYDGNDYRGGYGGGYQGSFRSGFQGGYHGGHEDRYHPDFRHPRADWGDGPVAGFDRPFFDRTTQDTVRRMALAPWNTPVPGTGVGYSLGHGVGRGRWL